LCKKSIRTSPDETNAGLAAWSSGIVSTCHPGLPDFFLVQNTKMGNVYQNIIKYAKWLQKIPNGRTIYQMAIKLTNNFHRKPLQNLPKLGFLFEKITSGNPAATEETREYTYSVS
jgi:hypothetical protein